MVLLLVYSTVAGRQGVREVAFSMLAGLTEHLCMYRVLQSVAHPLHGDWTLGDAERRASICPHFSQHGVCQS